VQVARDVCIAKNGVHDFSNVQDVEFREDKAVIVEDQHPSLNPIPKESSFIPPYSSSDSNDDIVNTNDASTNHGSSCSDESITRKNPKWFQRLLNERDDYLTRMGGLKPRGINYCDYALMTSTMHSNVPKSFEHANSQPH